MAAFRNKWVLVGPTRKLAPILRRRTSRRRAPPSTLPLAVAMLARVGFLQRPRHVGLSARRRTFRWITLSAPNLFAAGSPDQITRERRTRCDTSALPSVVEGLLWPKQQPHRDRKSTRLN